MTPVGERMSEEKHSLRYLTRLGRLPRGARMLAVTDAEQAQCPIDGFEAGELEDLLSPMSAGPRVVGTDAPPRLRAR
jgi:hypothetical protein